MLRVLINQATEGMRLAMPVVHPRSGNVLLRGGFVLTERVVRKLAELEVHEFWIDYPGTEEIRRFISPTIIGQQAKLTTLLASEFARVQSDGGAAGTRLDFAPYRSIMRDLIEMLLCDADASTYIVEMAGGASNMLRHSSEVSMLSIALGLRLQDYLISQRRRLNAGDARNVAGLGMGALVHDVGYLHLDEAVIERNRRCGLLAGDANWQQHVLAGHRLLSGSIPGSAAGVILQHHQHFDGSGFPKEIEVAGDGSCAPVRRCRLPNAVSKRSDADGCSVDANPNLRGLAGEEIHVFARIACLANHFDRLRRPAVVTAEGRPQPRVRVLRQLMFSRLRHRFDPVILAALPGAVPAYQPGSMVELSNGEHAVVLDWCPEQPCRPIVQVIEVEQCTLDGSNATMIPATSSRSSRPRYDLRENTDLAITSHEGVDVSRDNFDLPQCGAQHRLPAAQRAA